MLTLAFISVAGSIGKVKVPFREVMVVLLVPSCEDNITCGTVAGYVTDVQRDCGEIPTSDYF